MTSPEAVVFDLFNTLVDPELVRLRDPAVLPLRSKSDFWAAWKAAAGSMRRAQATALEALGDSADALSDRSRRELAARVYSDYQTTALIRPPARSTRAVASLVRNGISVGVLSNCDPPEVSAWSASPLAAMVRFASFSFEAGLEKPSTGAYLEALDNLGAAAGKSWFAGDGGSDELRGARQAGFQTVYFVKWIVTRRRAITPESSADRSSVAHLTVWSPEDVASAAVMAIPN